MLWLFVGPTGVYLLDFFCSGIQFYLLLSPYLSFIALLYLDLFVLGDDALITSISSENKSVTNFNVQKEGFHLNKTIVWVFFCHNDYHE